MDIKALFIPTTVTGVVYWRMYNPINAAIRNRAFDGHLLWWQKNLNEMHPWQRDILDNRYRARIMSEMDDGIRKSDVVVMEMLHTPHGLVTMQGIRECYGKPVVMEIDDNILSCPTYNPASPAYIPGNEVRKITIKQMQESDAIIVSTPYLKEIYSEFNDNIYVIPNCIDFNIWGKVQHRKNKGKITIGWVGGANHNDDLLIIEPAIEYLTAKYPQVEFVFGHGIHPNFRNKKSVRWHQDFEPIFQYPKAIAKMGFDIGIAPLVDNAFNRAKSNLRWLEYGSLGIPCVASNVGHFKETITNGVNGLLCDTTDDFIKNLEVLINDTAKRKEIGRYAYNSIFNNFNVDKICFTYADTLKEIVHRGQVTKGKESNFIQEAEVIP